MKNGIPNHVAIIMDGNGRWATRQGMKRTEGHYAGYKRLKKTALYILDKGVKYWSVFAFSTENFKRSPEEVNYLMDLFVKAFKKDKNFFIKNDIKVVFSGRGKPLSDEVMKKIVEASDNQEFKLEVEPDPDSSTLLLVVVNVLPLVLLVGVAFWFLNRQLAGNKSSLDFGKSKARLSSDNNKCSLPTYG